MVLAVGRIISIGNRLPFIVLIPQVGIVEGGGCGVLEVVTVVLNPLYEVWMSPWVFVRWLGAHTDHTYCMFSPYLASPKKGLIRGKVCFIDS